MDWKQRLAHFDRAVLGNAVPTPERFVAALVTLGLVAVAVVVTLSAVTAVLTGSYGPLVPALAFAALSGFFLVREKRKRAKRDRC